jgi:hypothetical protein
MLSLITIINFWFGIFLIYQIMFHLKSNRKEDFQMLMPIQFPYMDQPFFTNTVVKNTYYRNAKYHSDIDGLSMKSKIKMNF